MKRFLKRIGRILFYPFVTYFDRRFEGVHSHVDAAYEQTSELLARLSQLIDELARLRVEISAQGELEAELSATLTRFAEDVAERLERVGLTLDPGLVRQMEGGASSAPSQ